jgi:NAD(P)-dependent dehydrogenase (short-subunit alcohol dehydrogenase family)
LASGSETGARPLAAARSPRPAVVNPLTLFRDLERLSSSYTGKKDSPMSMKDKTIVVTGGSRGLGLGLVEALAEQGAKVTIVARDATALAAARRRFGVETIAADVAEEGAAQRILAEVRPEILVLNAGAVPRMGRLDQLRWADFTVPWETDVKAGLYWIQAALNLPLQPGARVLVGSSGAAQQGSPLSGGYAGAKRMLWIMAKYANGVAAQKGLNIRFQAIVPQQIIGDTGVGDEASSVYARAMGVEPEAFLKRFGAPMPPRKFGDHVVALLENPQYSTGVAFGLKGDTGITVLEEDAA